MEAIRTGHLENLEMDPIGPGVQVNPPDFGLRMKPTCQEKVFDVFMAERSLFEKSQANNEVSACSSPELA